VQPNKRGGGVHTEKEEGSVITRVNQPTKLADRRKEFKKAIKIKESKSLVA